MAIGADDRGADVRPSGATIAASTNGLARLAAASAAPVPVLAVRLAVVTTVTPRLSSGPPLAPVAAIAGLAATPAATVARAAPAVTVASRLVLLADLKEFRKPG